MCVCWGLVIVWVRGHLGGEPYYIRGQTVSNMLLCHPTGWLRVHHRMDIVPQISGSLSVHVMVPQRHYEGVDSLTSPLVFLYHLLYSQPGVFVPEERRT